MAHITNEQIALLEEIVDAYWTRVVEGTNQKVDFLYYTEGGGRGTFIQHPGLEGGQRSVDYGDLEELDYHGLVRLSGSRPRSGSMIPTGEGKHVVEDKRRLDQIARADEAISPGSSSSVDWEVTLPVLEAVVALYGQGAAGEDVSQGQVNQHLARVENDPATSRAFEVLERGGYVEGTASIDQLPGPLTVAPTEKALQLLAGWPASGAVALERLIEALQSQIDETSNEEEKSKLRAVLDAVQGVSQDLAAEVLAKVIMGGS